jgi:hypothetical protein
VARGLHATSSVRCRGSRFDRGRRAPDVLAAAAERRCRHVQRQADGRPGPWRMGGSIQLDARRVLQLTGLHRTAVLPADLRRGCPGDAGQCHERRAATDQRPDPGNTLGAGRLAHAAVVVRGVGRRPDHRPRRRAVHGGTGGGHHDRVPHSQPRRRHHRPSRLSRTAASWRSPPSTTPAYSRRSPCPQRCHRRTDEFARDPPSQQGQPRLVSTEVDRG